MGCARSIAKLMNVLYLLIGLAFTGLGVYLHINPILDGWGEKKNVTYGCFAIGGFLTLTAIFGFMAPSGKGKCMGRIVGLIYLTLALAFVGVGIMCILGFEDAADDFHDDECAKGGRLNQVGAPIAWGYENFCSDNCACTKDKGPADQLKECPNYKTWVKTNKYTEMADNSYDFFQKVEEDYNCAGLCFSARHFIFSPQSRGKPKGDCYKVVVDDLTDKMLYIGGGIAFFGFLTFIASLMYCGGMKKEEHQKVQDEPQFF